MKKKVLLSSIATIALCLCLIAGSTFALFTSKSEVNIAVTAGKVDMVAGIAITKVESVLGDTNGTIFDENGHAYSYSHVDEAEPYNFVNGGLAKVEGAELKLTEVTPGDKVTFEVSGTNNSDVAVQYRYIIECTDGYKLMSGMNVTVNGNKYTSMVSYTSTWAPLAAKTDIAPVEVSIELPVTAGNEYQEETTAIKVTVEAVQGNAVTEGDVAVVEYLNPVGTDEELVAALTEDKENIVVSLTDDVTYTVKDTASLYNMGGASTKTITINGNGHTLTFNCLSDNNNDIKTNNGAKLIINNTKLTVVGDSLGGAWNSHDIIFACDVELNNVTSDTAFALKADAVLNKVTIDDDAATDTYALWIQPNGQTVTLNSCTIDMEGATDGRGIKIDEQYLTVAAQKVTLNVYNTTIKTDEKAAIVVKSTAGAGIALSNVDISGVATDSTNAVWVDADAAAYYDLVTVNGGSKIQE